MTSSAERHVETADTIEAIEECFRLGWTDGLPVVPPADYKVREMLTVAGLTGEEELLNLDMRSRVITSENAAANAVMAGCQSEYFPVLVTALRTLEEERNLLTKLRSSSDAGRGTQLRQYGGVVHQFAQHSDGAQRPHTGGAGHQQPGRAVRSRVPR